MLLCCVYIHLQPTNSAKALYRRGYAHAAKKDWDKAEIDLDDAAAITPGDPAIVSNTAIYQLCALIIIQYLKDVATSITPAH
jgi:hypothetical protein